MIKVKKFTTPDLGSWELALTGMRNSYRSWNKSDSFYCYGAGLSLAEEDQDICKICPCSCLDNRNEDDPYYDCLFTDGIEGYGTYVLGQNDLNLFMNLCNEGSSNRKMLRQLPVMVQLEAPLYMWKQIDQYKVGTVTNSESTMHSIAAKEFTLDDFSMESVDKLFDEMNISEEPVKSILYNYGTAQHPHKVIIFVLNLLRDLYIETKDEKYKKAMIELLPDSYYQTRMWSLNYETIVNIAKDRIDHDLDEWRELIMFFIDDVPYVKEILDEIGIIKVDNVADMRTDFDIENNAYPSHTEIIQYWSDKSDRFELLTKRYKKGGEGRRVKNA